MIAAVRHVSSADVLFWLGVVIVVAAIVFAIVAARAGQWISCGLLLLCALVAAVLLL